MLTSSCFQFRWQATVTDSKGLTGTEALTVVVGEPFSLQMKPESGEWVVGDTIEVTFYRRLVGVGIAMHHIEFAVR